MATAQPDIVVGIDFGMTHTGVAYSTKRMQLPKIIQKWPGKLYEPSLKVPTILLYSDSRNNPHPEWGFPCQYHDDKKEWFKRYLDPGFLEHQRASHPTEDFPTSEEVEKWYLDYMRCLYVYISQFLQDQMGRWTDKRVEFLFSLPTTFRCQAISTNLRKLIVDAGFKHGKHTVNFGLTEPQASAVDAAKDSLKSFKAGEIILVCDAGGGTTDVALLEEYGSSDGDGLSDLKELAPVQGADIGSTNIDLAFERLVESRLQASNISFQDQTAWTMMQSSDFQVCKCSFGHSSNEFTREFRIPIPHIDPTLVNRQAGIKEGKMSFSQDDFKGLFDPQVDRIIALIRRQLDTLSRNHPLKSVNKLVLSGGLGSSSYLLKRLRETFVNTIHPAASTVEILVSEEPQLAVCRGLVIDRMQKITTNKHVLTTRVCSASYGVVCNEPYDKNNKKHVGQPTYKHEVNGKPYVRDQVDWMIKKGQTIDPDKPISHNFERIVSSSKDKYSPKENKIWTNRIVISHEESEFLPSNLKDPNCQPLCKITSNLSSVPTTDFDVTKQNRAWYKVGSRDSFRVARHQIKVVIGPNDIQFQLWFNDCEYTSNNSIEVQWLEGAAVCPPDNNPLFDREDLLGNVRHRPTVPDKRRGRW